MGLKRQAWLTSFPIWQAVTNIHLEWFGFLDKIIFLVKSVGIFFFFLLSIHETGISMLMAFLYVHSCSLEHQTIYCCTLQSVFLFQFISYKKALHISKHLDSMSILKEAVDAFRIWNAAATLLWEVKQAMLLTSWSWDHGHMQKFLAVLS